MPVEEQTIKYCEARANKWEKAAKDILYELNNLGAKKGQIIAIDAHYNEDNDDPAEYAVFSAWWNESLPDEGDLRNFLFKEGINDKGFWKDHYNRACEETELKGDTAKIFSITSSSCGENGVTYWFYGKDKHTD